MSTRILDGLAIAAGIRSDISQQVQQLPPRVGSPGLAVVLVGDNPASEIYVRNKVKACQELGIRSILLRPERTLATETLRVLIDELNGRDDVDGILVQLPLPAQIDAKRIIEAISPAKDVDGFHPVNVGRLHTGQECLTPCTPTGVLEILQRSGIPLTGAEAVVIGRSDIVGKPTSAMLLRANATVTTCHIHTVDLRKHTREADILVVAVGKPGLITSDMVKPGAVLIDVGINRITSREELERFFPGDAARAGTFEKRGSVVMGDVDPAAYAVCGAYTPVPGGVGALTIAMLMHNTVKAARMRRGLQ